MRESLDFTKSKGAMKVKVSFRLLRCDPACWRNTVRSHYLRYMAAKERTCWDPKDGELCLSRMKSEETLMEVRRGSDVQIDRQTWV